MLETFLLVLHFLYVGGGDCTILEYQNDTKKYLYCIDFGDNISLTKRKTDVVKYLEKLGCKNKNTQNSNNEGIKNGDNNNMQNSDNNNMQNGDNNNMQNSDSDIEFNCILTHPHFDHYQYLSLFNKNFDINKFYYSNLYDDYSKINFTDKYLNTIFYNKKVRSVVNSFSKKQKKQVFSDDIIFSDENICVKVLWPTKDYKEENNDFNDNSMVILITLLDSNKNIILMGDAGIKAEKEIMNKYPELKDVDIIKIGHHGHCSSSSQDFIDKMNPKIVINSAGPHLLSAGLINFHTRKKVMQAWQRSRNGEAKVYTTYNHGDIVITYDPKKIDFIIQK